ncbi:hypothetical protein D3C73_988030 [compost metagenome]
MRALQITSAGSRPDRTAGRQLAAGLNVNLALDDAADPEVVCPVAHEEASAVFKIQIRIDPALVHIHRLRPFTVNIVGPYIEVLAGRVVGGGHKEAAVIVTDRRGEYAAGAGHGVQLYLALAGQAMSDLLPVQQVFALEDRHSREELKRAAYQIVSISGPADAGIGIKSFDHGIIVFHCSTSLMNSYKCELSSPQTAVN